MEIFNQEKHMPFEYDVLGLIGEGGFGKVKKIQKKETNEIYALKVIKCNLQTTKRTQRIHLKREIQILSNIYHPAILKYISYDLTEKNQKIKLSIVTEYMSHGSLDKVIEKEVNNKKPRNWNETTKIINLYGIASAMSYLHSRKIIHRDLKPANILEDKNFYPRIADFGLAKCFVSESEQSSDGTKGTIGYIPPEVYCGEEWTCAGDVFSFSMIAYELLTLKKPRENGNPFFYLNQITNGWRPSLNDSSIKQCYKNLISQCWSENPEKRPSFEEITEILKNDEFITEDVDEEKYKNYIKMIEQMSEDEYIVDEEEEKCSINEEEDEEDEEEDEEDEEEETNISLSSLVELEKNEDFISLPDEIKSIFMKDTSQIFTIKPPETELLSKSICFDKIINVLNLILEVTIEIAYPSESFDQIFEYVKNIQEKVKSIDICIIVYDFTGLKEYLKNKKKVVSLIFDSSLNEIPKEAFCCTTSIKKITIPSSMKAIRSCAFKNCESLEEIIFDASSSLSSIDDSAFYKCEKLSKIEFPASLTYLGLSSFSDCLNLSKITLPHSLTSISTCAFDDCSSLKEVVIPSSVETIGHASFGSCTSIKRVIFEKHSSLKTIQECAFKFCTSLQKIEIPNSVTKIQKQAFIDCTSLKKVSIPSSVKVLEEYIFCNCTSLKNVSIPSSFRDKESIIGLLPKVRIRYI